MASVNPSAIITQQNNFGVKIEFGIVYNSQDEADRAKTSLQIGFQNQQNEWQTEYSIPLYSKTNGTLEYQKIYTYYDYTILPHKPRIYRINYVNESTGSLVAGNYRILPANLIIDDLVLSSNTHILTLAYNPDISSMKIVTGDTITQTLGSAYPYFRRNGKMKYKQLNIGGLISYSMDEAFMTYEDNMFNGFSNVQQEVVKEILFREQVLEFLYNNEPKVLKSTTEGCMIVKLSNISLTPNKQLGRMIYSFTAQATEYAEPTFENLLKYGYQQPVS